MASPVVVSPSIVTPGLYLSVNLLAGATSPSAGPLRVLLLAPKSSAGTLTNDTEIRAGGGEATAATAFGAGTGGHLAAKQIYLQEPGALIDFGAPAPGTGTPTLNITASGTAGATNNAVLFDICGREFEVAWNALETADTFKTRAIAAIVAKTQDLPVTAVSGGVGIITINGKAAGRLYNDVRCRARLSITAVGTEAINTNTHTNLTGGTTDPDFTNILAAAAGREYAYILLCISNTDAETSGGTSNIARVLTHIGTYNSGLNARLQQAVVATTSATMTTTKSTAITRNSQVLQWVYTFNGRSLPCEIAARELGGRLAAVQVDPAANRIGELYTDTGIYGSHDVIADAMTAAELEDALTNGITPLSFNSSGQLYVVRPITNYSLDSAGGADRRLLDVQNVDGTYAVSRDLRSALPQAFPNAKIQRDSLPGEEPPPKGVIEERDIKGFVISRLRFWAREGVILKSVLDQVIEDGTLQVGVNSSDPTQVDIVVPMTVVPPLAKMGVAVQRRPAV